MGVLNAELFEQSREEYARNAEGLVWSGFMGNPHVPPPPEAAKAEAFRLLARIDKKQAERHRDGLSEAFNVAYVFATHETWEGLHLESARAMIDKGLKAVERQHIETGEEPLSFSDPEDRLHYTTAGVLSDHPHFLELSQYVTSRAAYSRLSTVEDRYLLAGLKASGARRRRPLVRFAQSQRVAWQLGLTLGVLGVLGEVPPDRPEG